MSVHVTLLRLTSQVFFCSYAGYRPLRAGQVGVTLEGIPRCRSGSSEALVLQQLLYADKVKSIKALETELVPVSDFKLAKADLG